MGTGPLGKVNVFVGTYNVVVCLLSIDPKVSFRECHLERMKSVLSHVARFEAMLFCGSKGRIMLKFTVRKSCDAPQARCNVFRNVPGLVLSWAEPSS